jgi:hypothetical protein
VKIAGGIEVPDVVIDAVAIVGIALLDPDIGANEGLADDLGAYVADRDADDLALELG